MRLARLPRLEKELHFQCVCVCVRMGDCASPLKVPVRRFAGILPAHGRQNPGSKQSGRCAAGRKLFFVFQIFFLELLIEKLSRIQKFYGIKMTHEKKIDFFLSEHVHTLTF